MKNNLFFGSALAVLCGLAAGPLCQTSLAADTVAATASGRPALDFARASVGTQLLVREPGRNGTAEESRAAQALIADDTTASYTLSTGATSVLLTLGKIELLNRMSFLTQGAEGKVTVSVSSTKLPYDSASWKTVGSTEKFSGSRVVDCDLGSVEARYVKVDFATGTAGKIATLSLVGLPSFGGNATVTNAFVSTPQQASLSVSLNFVNLVKGAKVVAISKASSLGNVQNMENGNPEAAYTFDPTDAQPTLVVDLGSRQTPEQVVCAYKAPAGRLDLYLMDSPNAGAEQAVNLSYVSAPSVQPVANTAADKRKPVYSVTTAGEPNVSRLTALLAGKSGRYLIAEFHPMHGGRHVTRTHDGKDFKDYKDGKEAPTAGIQDATDAPVAGISTFGDPTAAQAVPLLPPVGSAAMGQTTP